MKSIKRSMFCGLLFSVAACGSDSTQRVDPMSLMPKLPVVERQQVMPVAANSDQPKALAANDVTATPTQIGARRLPLHSRTTAGQIR